MKKLTYEDLKQAVAGTAAGLRLRFATASDGTRLEGPRRRDTEDPARTFLAALAPAAVTYQRENGFDLRSRCALRALGPFVLELIPGDGSEHNRSARWLVRRRRQASQAQEALKLAEATSASKLLKSAQKAVTTTEKKWGEQIVKAVQDDGKGDVHQPREMLLERRGRQPHVLSSRTFHYPNVRYSWPNAQPRADIKEQLRVGLCRGRE